MTHLNVVNVLNPVNQVLVDLAGLPLPQPLLRHYIIKELASLTVFHDEIQLIFRVNNLITYYSSLTYFIKLNNIRMCHQSQYHQLSIHPFPIVRIFDPTLLQDLHRHSTKIQTSDAYFSPVSVCIAFRTFPNVPSPKALPRT